MMTSETIEFTLSIVLAVATVAYTIINLMMWVESRATRRQKMAPLMVAYLESTANKQILCLFIKNVGEGCAKNVKVKLLRDHDCLGKDEWPLSKFPLFNEGVNVFPSGYQLHYYIDYWDSISKNGMDDYIELEITYRDIKGHNKQTQSYVLEFNQVMSNYSTPPDNYEAQIPFYLEHISKALDKISKQK